MIFVSGVASILKCRPPPGGYTYPPQGAPIYSVRWYTPSNFFEIWVSESAFPAFWQHFWALLVACESILGIKISIRIIHEVFKTQSAAPTESAALQKKCRLGQPPPSPLLPLATLLYYAYAHSHTRCSRAGSDRQLKRSCRFGNSLPRSIDAKESWRVIRFFQILNFCRKTAFLRY